MAKRDYVKEYKEFHSDPLQKKRRAQRNAARSKMEKAGKVRKGQDVDHISRNPGGNLNNSMRNLRAQSPHKNRGRNN